jgi:hypothetical protein
MNDMRATIVPKSDQLNSDDLIGCTRTIKITGVSVVMNEQPVSIRFEGDNGKPYKPGKSMRRVLVEMWGPDANAYVGRSLTLYRDAKVVFGGLEVGGIRISHMSHIDSQRTMALTVTRANKKPFTVKPLVNTGPTAQAAEAGLPIGEWLKAASVELKAAPSAKDVQAILARDDVQVVLADDSRPKARDRLRAAVDEALERTANQSGADDIEDAEDSASALPPIENDPTHEAA